ncbi:small ribosomal subunit biogenesis GTPase RsgA 2, mitochondrial-like [Bidens hawaiensis]|uniref:small ribosomal subunit biogenesis GTPase RsgA 2, mitochondrial-like n=1 Tax=Bidens hawaiensis TaxID=980011 RepID=UPI00404B468B
MAKPQKKQRPILKSFKQLNKRTYGDQVIGKVISVKADVSRISTKSEADVSRFVVELLRPVHKKPVDDLVCSVESIDIPLTVALNKSDLIDEEIVISWISKLMHCGYDPVVLSVTASTGLDEHLWSLRKSTCVITGPSGSGKFSIICCCEILEKNS